MRIALTMRVLQEHNYREPRDAISHDWIRWLEQRGHMPILLPNGLADPRRYLAEIAAEAVVLTGGNDLVPRLGHVDQTAADRTRTETAVLTMAVASRLPVFGTCRGLHVINAHFGGSIDGDISGGTVRHVASSHLVALNGAFADLGYGPRIETNSFHNQGFSADRLAPDLDIFATAEGDGLIEGLVHPTAPIMAVQWHPERPGSCAAFDDAVFARLLEHGAFWSR
jgi:N5-(cytidine 5'-diphosphoramidyl)-L-glutamine hydrolase